MKAGATRNAGHAEALRLQRCMIDVANLFASCRSNDPPHIARTLVETLRAMLRLDLGYLRIDGEDAGFEAARAAMPEGQPVSIGRGLCQRLGDNRKMACAKLSYGRGRPTLATIRLSIPGDLGVLIAASGRPDFPTKDETRLLTMSVNQAGLALENVLYRARGDGAGSELKLKLVIDTTPALIWSTCPNGETDSVNKHFLDYVGLSWEALKGWGWAEAIHPDDQPGLTATWRALLASGTAGQAEARLRRHDGAYRWFLFRVQPLRDAGGKVVKWYGVNTDIEDRKRAEEALAASERNLRQTIDTIPAFVFCNSAEGPNEFLNKRWHDYTGITPEEARGRGWQLPLHPDDLPNLMEKWLAMLKSGEGGEVEGRMRRFDGVYRWFSFRTGALRDETGKIVKWYGTNTDIDDRKRAEAELREAHDRLNEAQRLSKTGSFITDLLSDDHNWSEEAYRIFEFDPETKVTVQLIRASVHPDDLAYFDEVIARGAAGKDVDFIFRIVTAKPALKYVRGVARVIEHVADRPLFIGALQDVTESKFAEEALNRASAELAHVSRLAALSTLTASIAHEVNQPLAGIVTNSDACLRMLASDPPNISGAIATARRNIRDANRASEVIARLRALFGKKELVAEPVDLNEATREVIALSRHELQRHHIATFTEFEEDPLRVTGDRVQLQQVILNLLLNASDAMKGVDDRPRQIFIHTASDGAGSARLAVRDTGVGLAPDALDKLFNAFYTTKTDGMGIGLSVSRSIIEHHHGRLWASPNERHGATFAFSIPLHRNEMTEAAALSAE